MLPFLASQPAMRAWAWTFWEAEVDLPAGKQASLVCKATDAAHNVQVRTVLVSERLKLREKSACIRN